MNINSEKRLHLTVEADATISILPEDEIMLGNSCHALRLAELLECNGRIPRGSDGVVRVSLSSSELNGELAEELRVRYSGAKVGDLGQFTLRHTEWMGYIPTRIIEEMREGKGTRITYDIRDAYESRRYNNRPYVDLTLYLWVTARQEGGDKFEDALTRVRRIPRYKSIIVGKKEDHI